MSAACSSSLKLRLCRHTWGVDEPIDSFFSRLRNKGKSNYEIVECGLIFLSDEQKLQLKKVLDSGVQWIAMVFTDVPFKPSMSVSEHLSEFRRQVNEALSFHPTVRPILFNVHGGKDAWSYSQACDYFQTVLHAAQHEFGGPGGAKTPIHMVHETHRGRILYNPFITRDLVNKFPDLLLCADYSHWVVVCERLLESEEDILQVVSERVRHVHARVGFDQGPQVSDPRAPEYSTQVAAHEKWWGQIFIAARKRNDAFITLTPEYGPPPYLHTLPHTNVPVANLEQIVDWAADRLLQVFAKSADADAVPSNH